MRCIVINSCMKALFLTLLAKIGGVSKALWDLISPILIKETGNLLEQVLPIAITYVTSLANNTGMTPQQKQQAAFNSIKAALIAAGIDASTSIINLAVEIAYARVKATSNLPK